MGDYIFDKELDAWYLEGRRGERVRGLWTPREVMLWNTAHKFVTMYKIALDREVERAVLEPWSEDQWFRELFARPLVMFIALSMVAALVGCYQFQAIVMGVSAAVVALGFGLGTVATKRP